MQAKVGKTYAQSLQLFLRRSRMPKNSKEYNAAYVGFILVTPLYGEK
jgi:hypothetical protein